MSTRIHDEFGPGLRLWNGLCPAGLHGLDHEGQICDRCPPTKRPTVKVPETTGTRPRSAG